MADDDKELQLRAGINAIGDAAEHLLELYMRMVRREADQLGPAIPLAKLEELAKAVRQNRSLLDTQYAKAFEACTAIIDEASLHEKRQNCLVRVLVNRFEDLLAPMATLSPGDAGIARESIPPFIEILRMSVGLDFYDDCYDRAREIVTEIKRETGRYVVWEEAKTHPQMTALEDAVLVSLAAHFRDFERRQRWFLDIMNGHLEKVADNAGLAHPHWRFEAQHMKQVMHRLYTRLTPVLSDPAGARDIDERLGAGSAETLRTFMQTAGV